MKRQATFGDLGDASSAAASEGVDENASTPKKQSQLLDNPFNLGASEAGIARANGDTPLKLDDLEVVAEDVVREDRISLASSQAPLGNLSLALPMRVNDFVMRFSAIMTGQEKQELLDLELAYGTVYYAADVPTRTDVENAVTNSDDADGYYIVKPKDQIMYRFEVLRVLGKGSFAQVVSAIDHLTGNRVAIKINRNTEIDHKFAKQEASLL